MKLIGFPSRAALFVCCLAASCHGSLPEGPLPKELAGDELQLHEVLKTIQSDPGLLWRPEAGHVRQFLAYEFHEIVTALERMSPQELKKRIEAFYDSGPELPPDLQERKEKTYDMGFLVGTLECASEWSRKNRIDRELIRPLFTQLILDAVCGPPGKKCVRLHYSSWGLDEVESLRYSPNPYTGSRSEVESFIKKLLTSKKVLQRPFYTTLDITGLGNDFDSITSFTERYKHGYSEARHAIAGCL